MHYSFKPWKTAVLFFLPLLFSCSEIRLIGAYNTNVDQSLQQISKDVSGLFVEIEKNIDDSLDWSQKHFRNSYVKLYSAIASARLIADGIPQYNIIVKQIDLLKSSLEDFEKGHKTGFVKNVSLRTPENIKKVMASDKSGIETAIKLMLQLQEGLKRK